MKIAQALRGQPGFLDQLVWWHRPYGERKYILMAVGRARGYKALFDESGIHDRAPICVIAGYVGTMNEWKRFEALWGPYANEPGFHAKRFFASDPAGRRVPPYDEWSDEIAQRYLRRLLDSITSLKLYPVGTLVDVRAFRQYSQDERRFLTGGYMKTLGKWVHSGAPTKPYYVAFWKAVESSLERVERNDWEIHFVFDRQHQFAPLALRLYSRLKNELDPSYSNRMGSIVFESRDKAIGLQAADLLAYCWYQFGRHGHRAIPEVHQVLSSQREKTLALFTQQTMDKVVGRQEPAPGFIWEYDPQTHSFRPTDRA